MRGKKLCVGGFSRGKKLCKGSQIIEGAEKKAEGKTVTFDYGENPKLDDTMKTTLYRKTHLRNAFLCLLALKQPKRFDNGKNVNLGEVVSSFNEKQRHHIFPRNILKKHFEEDEINSICNICFIPADLNEHILDKKPCEYFKEFKKELEKEEFDSILESHLIPYDEKSGIWDDDIRRGYRKFIENRAKLLQKEFERLLR